MIKKLFLLIFNERLFTYSIFGLMISCIILPNSLIISAAICLTVCFLCTIPMVKIDKQQFLVLKFWLASTIITVLYIVVGSFNDAPNDALVQVFLIYVVSPLMWIFVLRHVLNSIPLERITKYFLILGILISLSVALYIYLHLNYGAESVRFFVGDPFDDPRAAYTGMYKLKEAPILDFKDGYANISMHGIGSMIFITGGYISSLNFFDKNRLKYLILLIFLLVALVSGRQMLYLSILLGLTINGTVLKNNAQKFKKIIFIKNFLWLIITCFLILISMYFFDIRFESLLKSLTEMLNPSNGHWRYEMLNQFIEGIINHWGLGAGHGTHIAMHWIELQPWSYEILWISSIFKVGFIGAFIYAAPFFFMIFYGFRALQKGLLNENEIFVLGGGICAFIASGTNQYPEAFVFQWMYVLPVLYFTKSKFRGRGELKT